MLPRLDMAEKSPLDSNRIESYPPNPPPTMQISCCCCLFFLLPSAPEVLVLKDDASLAEGGLDPLAADLERLAMRRVGRVE